MEIRVRGHAVTHPLVANGDAHKRGFVFEQAHVDHVVQHLLVDAERLRLSEAQRLTDLTREGVDPAAQFECVLVQGDFFVTDCCEGVCPTRQVRRAKAHKAEEQKAQDDPDAQFCLLFACHLRPP